MAKPKHQNTKHIGWFVKTLIIIVLMVSILMNFRWCLDSYSTMSADYPLRSSKLLPNNLEILDKITTPTPPLKGRNTSQRIHNMSPFYINNNDKMGNLVVDGNNEHQNISDKTLPKVLSHQTPKKRTLTLDHQALHLTPPVIVGGTDGSGTRGIVALLLSCGVFMLSDAGGSSDCQYDVHGKELHPQGWPPVVQKVLHETHSPLYELANLSDATRSDTLATVEKMASSFRQRVQHRKETRFPVKRWGFKAPVSMYMLPFWARVFPRSIFIHAIRDGRDMCFHWLQSPVKRYWPHLFPKEFKQLAARDRKENSLVPDHGSYVGKAYLFDVPTLNKSPHYRIAELWQKSNLEVEAVGLSLQQSRQIEYLTVRSEDFLSNEKQFVEVASALLKRARPDMTTQEVCCIALTHWHQEHSSKSWHKNIQNYGKWKGAIAKGCARPLWVPRIESVGLWGYRRLRLLQGPPRGMSKPSS